MKKAIFSVLTVFIFSTMALAVDCLVYVKDAGTASAGYSFFFSSALSHITALMGTTVGVPVPQAEVSHVDGGRIIGIRTNEDGLCFFNAATGDDVKIYRRDYKPVYFKIPAYKDYSCVGVVVRLKKRD